MSGDQRVHLDNFSIPNFVQPTKQQPQQASVNRKLRAVEHVFTKHKLDLRSHVEGATSDLTDARVQSGKWFDRVVLLKGEPGERFIDTYLEGTPNRTFVNPAYTSESVRLLNELSNVRFVTQQISCLLYTSPSPRDRG